MAVGGYDRRRAFVDQAPALGLHLWAVVSEQARRVHLERPATFGQLLGETRIGQHRFCPLGMRDDRRQAGSLDPLADLDEELRGADERNLDEYELGALEDEPPRVVAEQGRHRRQLEPEPELERQALAELTERRADAPFAALVERRNVRTDVRCRIQDPRAVLESVTSEGQTLGHGLYAVVPGRHDVRVDVDEAGLHPATVATRCEGRAGDRARRCAARAGRATRAGGRARG